jgi:hypothetical protein
VSYEAVLDSDPEMAEQIATNKGMADFGRWVDSLPDAGEHLKQLRNEGLTDELDLLEAELSAAIEHGGDESAISVATGMKNFIARRPKDAEVIVITQ